MRLFARRGSRGSFTVEYALPRHNFGDSLIDRGVADVFRCRVRGARLQPVPLRASAIGSLLLAAIRTALPLRLAKRTCIALNRSLVGVVVMVRPGDRVTVAAVPIVIAEIKVKLILRLAVAAVGRLAVAAALPIIVAETPPAPLHRLTVTAARGRTAIPAALPIVVAETPPPFILRLDIAVAPGRRIAVSGALPIVVAQALSPLFLRFAAAAGWRIAEPRILPIFFAGTWPPAIVRLVVEIGRPPCLVTVLVSGLDDIVEPLTDRHTGCARGLARGRSRFRTETSEIPRAARFHSHVQVT